MRYEPPLALVAGLGGLMNVVNFGRAQVWSDESTNFAFSVCMAFTASADGVKVVGVTALPLGWYCTDCNPSAVLLSTNAGMAWSSVNFGTSYLSSVASSADGSKLFVVSAADSPLGKGSGQVYVSGDSGATWVDAGAPPNHWSSVASSALGDRLVAASQKVSAGAGDGLIYTSGDFGRTWTSTSAPSSQWSCVTSSADGTKMAAAGALGVYTSVDSGNTWVRSGAPTNGVWSCIASSADGNRLVAADGAGGLIYASTNAGQTWTPTTAPATNWSSVASSFDGTRLVAAGNFGPPQDNGGPLYHSQDGGMTWALVQTGPGVSCYAVTCSANGNSIVADVHETAMNVSAGFGTLYYTAFPSTFPAPPLLSIGMSAAKLRLSWLTPSSPFELQQLSDLGSSDWVAVTNQPILNFTNLHYEVTLPLPSGNAFYRLKQK
jgi:hypothetical protein